MPWGMLRERLPKRGGKRRTRLCLIQQPLFEVIFQLCYVLVFGLLEIVHSFGMLFLRKGHPPYPVDGQ